VLSHGEFIVRGVWDELKLRRRRNRNGDFVAACFANLRRDLQQRCFVRRNAGVVAPIPR
jgi:hypothetical protein